MFVTRKAASEMSEKYEYKKYFSDLESEENWITEMSEKGLALKNISGAFLGYKYSFEPCYKKYVYRVDYNNELPVMEEITSPYVMFVTGTYGAEYVMCRHGKVYFRKAADEGKFPPIYTTAESRLSVEKRIFWQWVVLAMLFVFDIFMYCTPSGAVIYLSLNSPRIWLKILAVTAILAGLAYCIYKARWHYKKIREIKNSVK